MRVNEDPSCVVARRCTDETLRDLPTWNVSSWPLLVNHSIRSDWANKLLEIWSWHLCFAEEPAKVCETCTQHVNLAHFSTQQDVQQIKQL
jgi:hypothetical protein